MTLSLNLQLISRKEYTPTRNTRNISNNYIVHIIYIYIYLHGTSGYGIESQFTSRELYCFVLKGQYQISFCLS